MKRYLSKLDKKERRENTIYYVMKSVFLDNIGNGERQCERLLFPDGNFTIKEETLYRIDVENKECHKWEEINSWQDIQDFISM